MLVLSRKKTEEITIGDSITVKVIEIRGGLVRLGIAAPEEMKILRTELVVNQGDEALVGSSGETLSMSDSLKI